MVLESQTHYKSKFMKKLLSLTLILLSSYAFSKEILITKQGGKPCKSDNTQMCYNRVYVHDTDARYTSRCEGRGGETCPKVYYVSIGGNSFNVEPTIAQIEKAIVEGETSGKGSVYENGVLVATYFYTGQLNEFDMLEYSITMNCIEK